LCALDGMARDSDLAVFLLLNGDTWPRNAGCRGI
jgi:hypothetical protein